MTAPYTRIDEPSLLANHERRLAILEALAPPDAGLCCEVAYEYPGLYDSAAGRFDDGDGIITGSSFALVGQAGTPALISQPPYGAMVIGHGNYVVADATTMNSTVESIEFYPTWLDFFGFSTNDFCMIQPGAIVGHGKVSRPHDEPDAFGQYSGGPPFVEFDLVASVNFLVPYMMYDGTHLWGGGDGAGAYPQYAKVPWTWQDGDEISAYWHTFLNNDCGD